MPEAEMLPRGEPDESASAQSPSAQSASAEEVTPDVPVIANRAERRAKGKGKPAAQPQSRGKGGYPGGRGSVQSPRQYGNRRSG